jgi:DNA topoisomerase-3
MNRRYGISADGTLKAAQSLYEAKLISYPRTDSRYLGADMKGQIPAILADLQPLKPAEIGALDLRALTFTGRIINDAKVGDHHAIIPTGKRPGELAPAAAKVFDAVVTRLIAAFYPACIKEVTTVAAVSNEVPFRARGVRVLDPGWTVLYPRKEAEKPEEEQELPEFRPGETGPHEPFVRRGETVPPKPFTEGSLLGAMETAGKLVDDEQLKEALKERGLGTPATRASIIETLLERGYITREKKALAATDLGRYLVALVQDRALKSPELTGEWEAKLREIERGRLDPRQFLAEIVRYTGELIRTGDATAVDPARLGECPRCGRPVIAGKRGFGCSGWRDGCPFVLWREYRGHPLGEDQIRELLQRRVLLQPLTIEGSGAVVLQLTDSGAVAEIPVPTGGQRPARGGTGGRRLSRPRKGTGTGPRDEASDASPKAARRPGRKGGARRGEGSAQGSGEATPGRRKRPGAGRPEESSETSAADEARQQAKGFGAVVLGKCPLCSSDVVEQAKSYGCSAWKAGCRFAIWKTIAGKAISARTAEAILRKGQSPPLKGFRSKAGNPFDARLKLEGGEVRFDFSGIERRRPPRSPDSV